jgi:hypothetical protein
VRVHPLGFPIAPATNDTCGTCGWAQDGRCSQAGADGAEGPVVDPAWPACVHHGTPDCGPCGACCREAFDSVPLGPEDDATAERHPDLVRTSTGWRDLVRVPSPTGCGTRCAALIGDGPTTPFRCTIYPDRPTSCRDLEPGSPNCVFARRRVGLSPATPLVAGRGGVV